MMTTTHRPHRRRLVVLLAVTLGVVAAMIGSAFTALFSPRPLMP